MAAWPSTLPNPRKTGTAETLADTTLRTEMDAGPAKTRRRFTAGVVPWVLVYRMTLAEAATLETFYTSTTYGGAVAFDWTHPRTGAAVSARFTGPPKITPDVGQSWRVDVALEVLP